MVGGQYLQPNISFRQFINIRKATVIYLSPKTRIHSVVENSRGSTPTALNLRLIYLAPPDLAEKLPRPTNRSAEALA